MAARAKGGAVSKTQDKAIERQLERMKVQYLAQQRFDAWKIEQEHPTAPPTPPRKNLPFMHRIATGEVVMPSMDLSQASEREKILEQRRAWKEGPGICTGWEALGQYKQFQEEEKKRYAVACELIRKGLHDGGIAATCHLEPEDVQEIRDRLEGRKPKGESQ
jgi:hypothetical protein